MQEMHRDFDFGNYLAVAKEAGFTYLDPWDYQVGAVEASGSYIVKIQTSADPLPVQFDEFRMSILNGKPYMEPMFFD